MHLWELVELHLDEAGAHRGMACTVCGTIAYTPPLGATADARPGLDFTIDDLDDGERSS